MLQNIRSNTQGIVAKFIIGLIIIPFALFGVDSLIGGSGPATAATVNDDDITLQSLDQAINIERRRLMGLMDDDIDPTLLDEKRLRGPAIERLIQQRLLLQAAFKAGISISPEGIDQAIINMTQFQQDGIFSAQLYQNVLRSNGYSTAYFKQLMTDDLVISQLNNGVAGSDFVTTQELEIISAALGQQRSFRYFVLPQQDEDVVVDDSQVQQFYDDNIAQFQTIDQIKLSYIEVKQQDFFETVDTQDVLKAYEEEMVDFAGNEERRAAHILIEVNDERSDDDAKQLIEKLASQLNSGDAFATLATEFSDDRGSAQSAGDLGYTSGDTFPPEFEQALFALDINEVSAPVKTDAGYHLIQAVEINAGDKPSFEDREQVLTQRLQLAAAEAQFVNAVEQLRDLVFNSEGLEGPAKELSLNLQASDLVSRDNVSGALAKPQVIAAAFSEEVIEGGNNSEVIELATDHFIVIHVLEHQPPRAKLLSEVQADISEQLRAREALALTLAKAEQSVAALKAGKTVEELANEAGYEWQVQQNLRRSSPGVDRSLLNAVFAMPAGSAEQPSRQAATLANGDVAIIQLEEVEQGSWSEFGIMEQRALKNELQRNIAGQSVAAYVATLRETAEVAIF
ncbi:MAG: peptidyl-prolyl cis-trans isomerase D [Oceanicoccus sp.]|jgi:peptidyl-prolyl cis-trans isomerase D